MTAATLYAAGALGAIALDSYSRRRWSAAVTAPALSLVLVYAGTLRLAVAP